MNDGSRVAAGGEPFFLSFFFPMRVSHRCTQISSSANRTVIGGGAQSLFYLFAKFTVVIVVIVDCT